MWKALIRINPKSPEHAVGRAQLAVALWPDSPGMVKVESMAGSFNVQCGGVQAYASSRLLSAGRGEVREDVWEAWEPVHPPC